MTVFGMPPARLFIYSSAAILLVGLNVARVSWDRTVPANPAAQASGNLQELPALAVAIDFDEIAGPPARNLFRADAPAPAAPPPTPEPESQPEPAPDPDARLRAEAESTLDSIGVIGFLSTGDGIVAVLNMGGSVVNAFKGDRPVPGFLVSEITINTVTLTHVELGLKRTYGLDDAD